MRDARQKKGKYVFLLLRLAVVIGGITWAVLWLAREQRWQDFRSVFAQMNPLVFAVALCFFLLSMVIVGLRWWLLLKTQSIYIDLWAAVKLYLLGWFYNNFMPSSVGGDLIRIWYVTKHTDKKFEAGLSVLVDRAVGLLSTLTIAGVFYFLFLRGSGAVLSLDRQGGGTILDSVRQQRLVLFWCAVGLLILLSAVLSFSRSRAWMRRSGSFVYRHGRAGIKRVIKAAILYCASPLIILEAYLLTVFLQLLVITGFWLVGRSMGIEVGVTYYYTFFTLVWVLGALPVSVGGAVVVEGIIVYMFTRFAGIEPEPALAIALVQRIIWMLASIPGAVIHIIGAHLPKRLSLDYDQPE